MIDAKTKAKELVEKFKKYANQQTPISYDYNSKEHLKNAKACAIIAVEQKIEYATKMAEYWAIQNGEWHLEQLSHLQSIIKAVESM